MGTIDYGIAIRPLNRYLSECGDTGKIYQYSEYCCLALVDVLGHGAEARAVAIQAETYLDAHYTEDPVSVLQDLHSQLSGTRGAVAAFCRLNLLTGLLEHAGIGNISVKLIAENPETLISRDGILGYRSASPHIVKTNMKPEDILLLHSDGIKSRVKFSDYPELLSNSAQEIADTILKEYGTKEDDASCIVMKYQE
jgi:phosphoserine phosphatase RsbX